MWPSITAMLNDSAKSFGPLVYWVVFGAAMVYYCIKYPLYRNKISYICLLACVFGIVASIISILTTAWGGNIEYPAYFIFYGLYNTFAFLPPIAAFYAREKHMKQSNAGKYTTYLGFLWAAACILGSLATTIMAAVIAHQGYLEDEGVFLRLSGGLYFIILMNWGFIAVLLLLTLIYFKRLTQKYARGSFLIYVLLTTLSTLVFTILGFAPLEFNTLTVDALGYLSIFLVDLPLAVAVFIAFYMGRSWIGDNNQANLIIDDTHDTQNHQEQQYNGSASADVNANDGSKYELSNSA
ncbi:hypothetical protein MUCCIDRAFT_85967 [Mucor lusitanicus CBS 277.49]|uniref:Uncharacterized protein n=2 Tax=Mucor circinelloides f. lusitanicus TaxID=29924 RepID=A0A168IZM7_MUCCL|nr:hypothetical protein MUCCIDRAFT_85967 [Mucor lusitanicus CBS 277.49]